MSRSNMSVRERFDAKYIPEPNSGCWLWDAAVNNYGYGVMTTGSALDGTRRVNAAHRLSYESHVGPIPEGMLVCHKCDVPGCVNPQHLFLGSDADNTADKVRKGREARGDRVANHGEASGSAKLTEGAVRAIRRDYATGRYTQRALGLRHGVVPAQVSQIVTRKAWKRVADVEA